MTLTPLDMIAFGILMFIASRLNRESIPDRECRLCNATLHWTGNQWVHLDTGDHYADTPGIPRFRHQAVPR